MFRLGCVTRRDTRIGVIAQFWLPALLAWPPGGTTFAQVTYHVDDDSPSDPGWVDPAISDPAEDGSSDHPFDSIQEAIDVAMSGDIVEVRHGLYFGEGNRNISFGGRALTVRAALNATPTVAAVDYGGKDEYFGFVFVAEGPDAVLDGIHVQEAAKAGLLITSNPTIRNCRLENNRYGIQVLFGAPNIESCAIEANQLGGISLWDASAYVKDCTISFNLGEAGVVAFGQDASVIEDCTFDSNIRGVLLRGDDVFTTMRGCAFRYNVIRDRIGGAGLLVDGASPMIEDCEFHYNQNYKGPGGAVSVRGGEPQFRRCDVRFNSAEEGGGMSFTGGWSWVRDSVIADNEGRGGGGIHSSVADAYFTNCTIYANRADPGFGQQVHAEESLIVGPSLYQSIVWAQPNVDDSPHMVGPVRATYCNLIEPASLGYHGNFYADPLFAAPFPRLQAGSPCINAGDPHFLVSEGDEDYEGNPRIQQCRIDVGAMETNYFVDCDGSESSDACQIADDPPLDCDQNGDLDECEMAAPTTVFHETFDDGEIHSYNWLLVETENTFPYPFDSPHAVSLNGPFTLESPRIDLQSARAATLTIDYLWARSDQSVTYLLVEFWDGLLWTTAYWLPTLTRSQPQQVALRRHELPVPREAVRFRLRVPEVNFEFTEWILADIRLEREHSDCDGNLVMDVCDAFSKDFPDCNGNFRDDGCDLYEAAFAKASDENVGAHPQALTTGDFDRDGDTDLVVARGPFNSPGAIVSLQNDGHGFFTKHSERTVGQWPRSMLNIDVDGDGWLDIVHVNTNSDTLAVHRNAGGAWWGFAPPVYYPVQIPNTEQLQTVAAGDLDRDGDPDLITATGGSGRARVMLNAGDGTFAPGLSFQVPPTPRVVMIADYDGDGWLDAAVLTQLGRSLSVALNRGGIDSWEGFDPPVHFVSGSPSGDPFHAVTADFNGDGAPDVAVVAGELEPKPAIALLLNQGFGKPWPGLADDPPMLIPVGQSPTALAVADFNGDGWTDLAATLAATEGEWVLVLNRGEDVGGDWLGMEVAESYASGSYPMSLAPAEINGDTSLDLIVGNRALNFFGSAEGMSSVSVFFQAGRSGFDCNGNAMPDGCDIEFGDSGADSDDNGVPDECQPDCNGNGVPDDFDITFGPDCNRNRRLDRCEIDDGALDCNLNGRPDECELPRYFEYTSEVLTPVVDPVPQQFVIEAAPPATGDVSVRLRAHADLGFGDYMEIHLGDLLVGRLESPPAFRCQVSGVVNTAEFFMDAEAFNAGLVNSDAVFHVTTNASQGCYPRTLSESYAVVIVSYRSDPGTDFDENGLLDVCIRGDTDLDGDLDLTDAAGFPECMQGPKAPFPQGCFALDMDLDGDVDLMDAAGFGTAYSP